MCNRGRWEVVCNNNFGSVDAGVVCSQLGFRDKGFNKWILDNNAKY